MAAFYTDSHIALGTGTELVQRGHTVVRCFSVGLLHAPDHVHLRYAALHDLIVITHDRGFVLWNQAWNDWSSHFSTTMHHFGILILPIEKICPEPIASARIDELIRQSTSLANSCLQLTDDGRWLVR